MRCLALALLSLVSACGGLHSSGGAGGGSAASAECLRALPAGTQVPSPAAPDAFTGVRSLAFTKEGLLVVLNRGGENGPAWVTVLGPAPQHAFMTSFGRDVLTNAVDLALDGAGLVYVLELRTNARPARVTAFTLLGHQERQWSANGGGQGDAFCLTFDGQGRVVVGGEKLFRYRPDGTFLSSVASPVFPAGILSDPAGVLWVADLADNSVHAFDADTGAERTAFGGRGTGPGRFDGDNMDPVVTWGPSRLALDSGGNLYANDPYASRVQKLDRQGGFLGQLGFGGSRQVGPLALEPSSGRLYIGRDSAIDVRCPL